jgi:hypothetical protein
MLFAHQQMSMCGPQKQRWRPARNTMNNMTIFYLPEQILQGGTLHCLFWRHISPDYHADVPPRDKGKTSQ